MVTSKRNPRIAIASVLVLAAAFAAAGTTSGTAAAPAPSAHASATPALSRWQQHQQQLFHDSAPADEYFGRMKMSYLGMNNTFRDAAISAGDHTTDAGIAGRVALAEDALEAWAAKYPRDPQLARTYYLATVVERKIWIQANQQRAWIYLKRLVSLFPDSYFGKAVRRDLGVGFTEHYYANPEICPTAPPTTPPDDAYYLLPFPTPSPAPPPTPTPLPVPTPTTLDVGLRALVLPQPCVPPASPSPSPSSSPTASPEPTAVTPSLPTASPSMPARS